MNVGFMRIINKYDRFLLEEIVKRNFSSKYKDSALGIFWSVLRPLLLMIVFTIIFSTMFGGSIEYFPVYFLSGRCIFEFFTGAVHTSMDSIKGNKNIILRTPVPKYIFILGSIISEFYNFIISVVLLILVMIVINVPFNVMIMPLSIIPVFSLLMMITGWGLILSIVSVYYTDIQHLWSVATTVLMYASAIFYPMSLVPEPYRSILMLNPMYWIVDQFRCFIYQGIIPQLGYIINSLLISAMILVIGIIIFKKYVNVVSMKL